MLGSISRNQKFVFTLCLVLLLSATYFKIRPDSFQTMILTVLAALHNKRIINIVIIILMVGNLQSQKSAWLIMVGFGSGFMLKDL